MPLSVGYGITRGVTEIAYRFSPSQRSGIESNVRHVLGQIRPDLAAEGLERKVDETVHSIFKNRGVWFADLSVMAGNRRLADLFRFRMEGDWSTLQRALASGKGAILASAHLGNWHGGGVAVARRGVQVRVVMYRNHAAEFMDRKVARRGKVRQTFIDDDPMSMMEIVRALQQGEVLAMLVDKPWDSRSMAVPFFGKPSLFPLGPVRLARLAGVPIFPAFCVWNRLREFEAILCDPIEVGGGDPEQAEYDALSKLSVVIQKFVTENLHVWFNFTPAWSTP
jgi:KDO2-lipid IV(A) lauroyltransferase